MAEYLIPSLPEQTPGAIGPGGFFAEEVEIPANVDFYLAKSTVFRYNGSHRNRKERRYA